MIKLPSRTQLIKLGIPAVLIPGMIFAAQLGWNWQKNIKPNVPYTQNQQIFPATDIITDATDGDTLILQSGIRLRLLGINSPERGQPYFEEAKNFTLSQTKGKKVRLEYELGYQNDKFGRILAYVWINNNDRSHANQTPGVGVAPAEQAPGVLLLNELLVREGLAQTSFYKDRRKLKYQDQFLQAESAAKSQHLNLWSLPPSSPTP